MRFRFSPLFLPLAQLVRLEEEVSAAALAQGGGGGRKSVKLKPHAFMLLQSGGKPVLLAAETAEEKGAWLDALRGFARRSLEAFVKLGSGACKWLAISDEQEVEAQRAGQELLLALDRAHGGAHANMVAIFGQARQGKSTFINLLAGAEGVFDISHDSEPCTSGADVSSRVMTLGRFRRGGVASGSDNGDGEGEEESLSAGMVVGFVDAEGKLSCAPMLVVSRASLTLASFS